MSSLLMHFQPQSETEPEIPSDEYIKIGFVKAFNYLKIASREQNIEIESALMLVPDFFNSHVRKLVEYAAIEAGVVSFGIESPQEMIKVYDEMFDDEINAIPEPISISKPSIMIVDYGLQYLHLHTRGRTCQTKHALDTLGCSGIWRFLYYRFLTLDGPLKRQIEKGASRHDLFSALWQARFFMKQPMEEGQDHYEEWPLDLQDWWIGEQEEAVLRWEDVEAAESDYIDELANYLNQALDCLQGQEDKHALSSNPIDRVYMLGNFCDRPIVKKAIQKSVGEHVKIIGGSSELDNGLAARGGARYAFVMAEPMNEVCRKEKLDYDEL
ncbi:hypothetical protein N7490_003366 [Penicillium lividum]|nr:hypothetical protein N7490_003366 [Penicillium lividum]